MVTIEDTAKVFDRYADCIVFRTSAHDRILQMSDNCSKSGVVNALTDESHPCQIMADIMRIIEQFGSISGKKIAWIGDVNNVLKSWIAAAGKFDFTINVCCPLELSAKIPNSLKASFIQDKFKAVEKCDVVTTDTWVSMGEDKAKIKIFDNFTVDKNLMNFAKKDAIFLHCLPAYREYEVSSDVLDDEKYSKIVFNEAENRQLFKELMQEIGEPVCDSVIAKDLQSAINFSNIEGFPLIIRASLTLGGTGGGIANCLEEFEQFVKNGLELSPIGEVLVEKSIYGWKEAEYEIIRDGNDTCIMYLRVQYGKF